MEFTIFSESYLPWEEYCKLVEDRERLVFMTVTARKSLKNIISKGG